MAQLVAMREDAGLIEAYADAWSLGGRNGTTGVDAARLDGHPVGARQWS
jgi:hypothetical protein